MTIGLRACFLKSEVMTVAVTSAAALVLSGCGSKTVPINSQDQNKAINRLELRIEQLERQVDQQLPPPQTTATRYLPVL